MNKLRKEFPVLSQNTYLNTASSGLLYDSLLEYRQVHDLDFLIGGSTFRNKQSSFLNTVRQSVGNFFECSSKDVILTQNFSLGLNTILHGLDTTKKVLLLDQDYPSVNFSFISKGFNTCYAKVNVTMEQNIETIIEEQKPDIFAFSLVQYINGITIDLDFIKRIKTKYPNMLIIGDGTQFCGTTVFNFNNSGIDILGCSGYKWLLGGYGNGFLLFQPGIAEKISPELYKKSTKETDYDASYTSLRARFECGHMDTLNFGSLQYSLEFLSKIGLPVIEKKIQKLANYAKEEFIKLDLLEKAVVQRKNHSSIFNIKGDNHLFNTLQDNNIITSLRGQGIRISIHFYNTKDDIDRLLSILKNETTNL
ncbi:aminotransferase class V-fold PLP-dependent enzyme [Aquimarina sp. RZ0]|uniref:aminotransferase class V-fold PLP-dependent enzyme n=1 Tax=Aquimarina sp. RZ0 TaxID=2607730 RepID=UPI0011F26974|nr:aminotransferase class V-fold PLP-dependent enzyme [Aquimarina sp. RZ0]KAA1245016.1 aminotransferase class V-fold PLP-dependent enzyme [Aquimarina sp. RZ0]